jgi:hypothetical protein
MRCLQLGQQLLKLRCLAAADVAAAAAAGVGDGASAACSGVGKKHGLIDIQQVVQLARDACSGWL